MVQKIGKLSSVNQNALNILEGRVATSLRITGIFNNVFITNLPPSINVKEV